MTVTTLSPELNLAAWLADPVWSTTTACPALDPGLLHQESDETYVALQSMLRHNRVSLLPALRSGTAEMRSLLALPPLAAYVVEEEHAYRRTRQEYATIRSAFAGAGIRDVLIKSAGVAPSFPHLSDNVDDLVPAESIPVARAFLRALGYVELRNLEEPRKFFFKRFSEGHEVAAHHLHEHVGWAVSFLDEALVLQRARPAPDDADLLIPHPEDCLLITIAHALYENKAVKLGDLVKVRHCLRTGGLDWQRLRDMAESKGWLDGLNILVSIFRRLDEAIYGESLFPPDVVQHAERSLSGGHAQYVLSLFDRPLTMPLRVSFSFSKRLFYAKCLHDHGRSGRGKVYDVVRHTLNGTKLKLKLHSQPGMLITFSGVDGSGKTRHAQALVHAFHRCDIRADYVWSRSGSSRLTDLFVRAGKTILRQPTVPEASQEKRASGRRAALRNPPVRLVWTGLVAFDLLWQYMVRVRLPLLIGHVVVCDRYTYDALVDVASVTGQRHRLLARILTALSPAPSPLTQPFAQRGKDCQRAAFLLAVAPEVAAARRAGDVSEATINQQADLYDTLAKEYGLVLVDNSCTFADANDAIVRTVIRSYYAGYHTVLNALLMANPYAGSQ